MALAPKFLLLGCFALSSCAQNTVRLESASSVSQMAATVAKDARSYFGGLGERRREANVALVASHPSCRWGNNLLLLIPNDFSRHRVRCANGSYDIPRGFRGVPMSLRGIPEETLSLAVTQLAVVTAYERALLSALEAKPSQLFDDLAFAAAAAGSIPGDLAKFGLPKNIIGTEQAKAAQDLVALIDQLREEAEKVEAVREVVKREGGKVPIALDALSHQLVRLGRLYDAQSGVIEEAALTSAYEAEASRLSFDERRRFVAAIATARGAREEANARIKPLQTAISELKAADVHLRDALAGEFNPKDERRIRELNRKRLLSVVSLIAGLLPA